MFTTHKADAKVVLMTLIVMMLGALTGCLEDASSTSEEEEERGDRDCGSDALYSFIHESCEPMDAEGDNACYCLLGYAWAGAGCEAITGCECLGEDCDSLSESEEDCLEAHGSCGEDSTIACGDEAAHSRTVESCEAMDVTGQGECYCATMGYFWDGDQCSDLTGVCECVGADCDALYRTEDECVVAHESCEEPIERIECGSQALHTQSHESCGAMDAEGEGACYCILGVIWNGESCVSLSGFCECVGSDCDSLYFSEEECLADHEAC